VADTTGFKTSSNKQKVKKIVFLLIAKQCYKTLSQNSTVNSLYPKMVHPQKGSPTKKHWFENLLLP